ncbi:MAG: sigma-54-dependent Fis family transcriptional regulator [Acidobacteria bacterium]|nr:MAG: sigma-54-dependent Fis family transcriptional regulator [Acidobacteriota bacterium]
MRILVVDDEKQIRRILSVLLTEHNYEVAEASSGEEALRLQPEFQPALVLLDLSMPGMDGLETLKQLMQTASPPEVIMMTAFGTIRSAVEAMRLGAFDYLSKPFDNEALLLTVDRALERRRLSREVEALRTELETRYGFSEIIGLSSRMQEVFRMMAKVARVDATVLITGESGTGKELVARAIHRRSARCPGPFVSVNCSAIPDTLVESEFFGSERGAFTDARESRAGKFETAHSGSLFLDEIGDLALDAQAKLLRVLQERQVTRLGGTRSRSVDVRVICATNRNLEQAVSRGEFREDLYWRINVVNIKLPPLRDRKDDLPLLIDHFLDHFNKELGLTVKTIGRDAKALLLAYDWPGNVRELENTLCRAMILCECSTLSVQDLPPRIKGESEAAESSPGGERSEVKLSDAVSQMTERIERTLIVSRLAHLRGNRTLTAQSLGVSRKTLFNKMRQYGLTHEENDEEQQLTD